MSYVECYRKNSFRLVTMFLCKGCHINFDFSWEVNKILRLREMPFYDVGDMTYKPGRDAPVTGTGLLFGPSRGEAPRLRVFFPKSYVPSPSILSNILNSNIQTLQPER